MKSLTAWWAARDRHVKLHIIYGLLIGVGVCILLAFIGWHRSESARLNAAVELADQHALQVEHDAAQQMESEKSTAALSAAQAAQAAATQNIGAAASLRAAQAAQAKKLAPVTDWSTLNKMAGVQ
jgi:hypothetical protein